MYECEPVVKPLQVKLGPPRLLRKPLLEYFNHRLDDHIGIDPSLSLQKSRQFPYSVGAEEIVARHEIACLDTKLTNARKAWAERKKVMDDRWKHATDNQKAVFSKIPQFNHYYNDLFVRRDRANHQLKHETALILEKERELRMKKKEMEKLTEIRDISEERLGRFSIFKTYLQQAKEMSHGEYGDIKELIDRYNTLQYARDSLTASAELFRSTVTKRQRSLDNDVEMKSNEILAYRNYLSEMLEYDTILREKVFWLEDGLTRIKCTAALRTLIIGQIKMAIHNIYRQICTSLHRHATIKPEDTLGQLTDIRLSIVELTKLSHDIHRMMKAAHIAAKEEQEAKAKLEKMQQERQKKVDKLLNKQNHNVFELFNISTRKSQQMEVSKLFFPRK